MDPITLAGFMEATGPIADPISGDLITSAEIGDVLLRDSYVRFPDPAAQDAFLGDLVRSFWDRVQNGEVGPEVATAVGAAVRTGHLKVYSGDPEEQAAMVSLHADGNYASWGPAAQLVFNENYAVNKVDYYLHRTVDTRVELHPEGGATFTTSVAVENHAPSTPPSLLIGEEEGVVPPGTNRMVLAVALPSGAEADRTESDGETLTPFTYKDSGHTVMWDLVTVPPGETAHVIFVYSLRGPPLRGGGELTMTLVPQTTVNPDRFSFELIPAGGSEVIDATGAMVRRGRAIADGELLEPRVMSFIVRRTHD
jgi:hypothetical protein